MAKDEAHLGQTPPVRALLVEYLVLGLLEQPHGLPALVHEVLYEYPEVLVVVQERYVVLVLPEYRPQELVRVGEDVQDEGRAVLEVHPPLGAEVGDLLHHLPHLLDRLLIDRRLGRLRLKLLKEVEKAVPVFRVRSHL